LNVKAGFTIHRQHGVAARSHTFFNGLDSESIEKLYDSAMLTMYCKPSRFSWTSYLREVLYGTFTSADQ